SVRAYVNGRFVEEFSGDFGPGKVVLDGKFDVHLLSLNVRPLEQADGRFVFVPLDDLFNESGQVDASRALPQQGVTANVAGVPFIGSKGFSGEDHLDVGRSVYIHRMGDMNQGDPRKSVHLPEMIDVTRFTLRVPRHVYRRAWVLAASDGRTARAPVLTLRFYRPRTSWNLDATLDNVPAYEATSAGDLQGAKRIGTDTEGMSLWLIPIELDAASLAADPKDCVELTKEIYPYRGFPDPAYYSQYPGGLPSSVQVYGLTLEVAPLEARGTGARNANLYPDGEIPVWRVLMKNTSDGTLDANVHIKVTGPYGQTSDQEKNVSLQADGQQDEVVFKPPTGKFGIYTVQTTVSTGDFKQTRERTFLKLAARNTKATPENSPWGLWCWNGGHETNPDAADNMRILKALGAINSFQLQQRQGPKQSMMSLYPLRKEYGIGAMHYRLVDRKIPDWATKVPYDPKQYEAFAEEKGREAAKALADNPDLIYVNLFAENYLSLRLTHGMSPWAMGQPWFELDEREAERLRSHWLVAKAAHEGVRKYAPQLKILFGHGAANFAQPFFREPDWDDAMFDGFGMDLPQFERMPERQPRATEPSLLYFLHHQMKEMGLVGKEVVHLESYFPPSGPLRLTFDEQADTIVRTAVLSMALGTTKFMRTWELHTSGDGWGSSHYGSAGLIDRAPEFNPKPAAAAFATMTNVLDLAKYDGYLNVGSRSAFCIR
ncbi:MAG: hypothetical protein JJ992_19795, partial [Planctomycetes bacterium]|nr:hypothetical protein [Planctomycetota bacterium]